MSLFLILVAGLALVLALASLAAGIYCLVRYAKTRKVALLITGLVLTFVLPGICLVLALVSFIPSTTIVYGPPPLTPTPPL